MSNPISSQSNHFNQVILEEIRKSCIYHPKLIGKKGWVEKTKGKIPYWRCYSTVMGGNKPVRTHRVLWIEAHGTIPIDKIVLHTCGNSLCLNIYHLRLGTHKENSLDKIKHGTSSHINRRKLGGLEGYKEICRKYASGMTQVQLAKEYCVRQCTISAIIRKYRNY